MTTDPTALTGLPLRAAVAVEIMGYQESSCRGHFKIPPEDGDRYVQRDELPPWEHDRTAAQQVLTRVEERWGREPFITYLHAPFMKQLKGGCTEFMWTLVNVTAEQICLAALQTARRRDEP